MLFDKRVKKVMLLDNIFVKIIIWIWNVNCEKKKNWFCVILDVKKYEFYNRSVFVFKVRVVVLKSGIFVELL